MSSPTGLSIRGDVAIGFGFALTTGAAHMLWHFFDRPWEFIASALVLAAGLAVWLWRRWRRLKGFVTKFYCLVALADLLAEGLLQPVHDCTRDNLLCTGRLFLVFLGFWLVLQPLERRFLRRSLILIALALPLSPNRAVADGQLVWASSERQTALIELFTSEGCSSCPPAEAWLSRLTQHPKLWTEFVPVAFHVDYWDYLGWKDRFASAQFTQRQGDYVSAWRSRSMYTPGFVVNGRERSSSGRAELLERTNARPGVLRVECAGTSRYAVRFIPTAGLTGPFDAHVVLVDCGLTVKVARGENAGRELRHDFLARLWQDAPLRDVDGMATADLTVADPPVSTGARRALAVWVTQRGVLTPLQATGGWLE